MSKPRFNSRGKKIPKIVGARTRPCLTPQRMLNDSEELLLNCSVLFMLDCKNYILSCCVKKSKGKFLYSAVSSPQDRSKRFTFYFPDRSVHSDTISASLGSIHPYDTINARWLLVHISTTVLMGSRRLGEP